MGLPAPLPLAYRAKDMIEALRQPRPTTNERGQPIDPIPPDPAIVDALETVNNALLSLMQRMDGAP